MPENQTITDAALVAGHLAGDRGALAAIYDRYAGGLYDVAAAMLRDRHDAADVTHDVFVVAAERMGQLRDPSRLRPWLMAIMRNEVYRRTGRRSRTVPTDFGAAGAEMALPPEAPDEGSAAEYAELATLVREAAAGLDPRDQLVLELSVRQGLDGDDLAAALGVTAQQSYSLVHRMRQRTERSLGAFCVARQGRRDCPQLDQILAAWDGRFSVLVRKRVARHVDGCAICERTRRKLVPLMLFGAAPAFAAPPELRDRVLTSAHAGALGMSGTGPAGRAYGFTAPGGFPSGLGYSRRVVLWWLMTAGAVMLLFGGGVLLLADDGGGPAQLAIDAPPPVTTAAALASTSTTAAPAVAPPPSTGAPPSTEPATSTTLGATSTTRPGKTTPGLATTTTITLPFTQTTVIVPGVPPLVVTTTTAAATTTVAAATTTIADTTTTEAATTTVPPPAVLALSAGTLDFGGDLVTHTAALTNTGGTPADWTASIGPAGWRAGGTPFDVSPSSGSLAPGASQLVTVTLDRSQQMVATTEVVPAAITFTATGTSARLTATGVFGPSIELLEPGATACSGNGVQFRVRLHDLNAPAPDTTDPPRLDVNEAADPPPEPFRFDPRTGEWVALAPLTGIGEYPWTITAADRLGNRSELRGNVTLARC
jgi:RNA polymerase sigma factor (sigma-70 family)